MLALSLALTIALVVLERNPRADAARWSSMLTRPLPERVRRKRVAAMLEHFVEGLGLFRDLPRLLWVFAAVVRDVRRLRARALALSMWALAHRRCRGTPGS